MSLIQQDLFNKVLLDPIRRGANELFVVTGYASAGMVTRHFEIAAKDLGADISIDLVVGMTGRDGISRNTLMGLQSIPRQIGDRTFRCSLTPNGLSIHSKLYVWCDASGPKEAFIGSSNYTQLGFGLSSASNSHKELCSPVDAGQSFEYALAAARGTISYRSPDLSSFLKIFDEPMDVTKDHEDTAFNAFSGDFVDLPLFSIKGSADLPPGEVPTKSGLNWGQRPGRNPDQAYIPVSSSIAKQGFFPERGAHFQVVTDDGEAFICTVAQDGDKAIETPHDNSILGKYFRRRLGLKAGDLVTAEDLNRYGSNFVRFYRVDSENFGMRFKPGQLM